VFESGWAAGGDIRYNYQLNQWLVLGLEGRLGYLGTSGSNTQLVTAAPLNFPASATSFAERKANGLLATLGGTAMILLRPDFGVYGGGGGAWRNYDVTHTNTFAIGNQSIGFGGEQTGTKVGGVVWAGIDYAWNANWDLRLEYDHFFFGGVDTPLAPFSTVARFNNPLNGVGHQDLDIDMVAVSVNYRFTNGLFNF
jgi:opacity protein-like surface antigen